MKKLVLTSNSIIGESSLPSIHAEHMGFLKFMKLYQYQKIQVDIMVLRIAKNNGTLGYSRPCKECLMRLSKSGIQINDIYYSDTDTTMRVEKFAQMKNSNLTKSSSGTRKDWQIKK